VFALAGRFRAFASEDVGAPRAPAVYGRQREFGLRDYVIGSGFALRPSGLRKRQRRLDAPCIETRAMTASKHFKRSFW